MVWSRTAKMVYADGPFGSPMQPAKSEIRPLLKQYEDAIDALTMSTGAIAAKGTLDELKTVSANEGDGGIVFADENETLRGIYVRIAGAWAKKLDLPADVASMAADDAGAARAGAEAASNLSIAAKIDAQAARDIAAGYASDASNVAGVPIYATIDGMSGLTIPAGTNAIRVNGNTAAGDGGGGLFVNMDNGTGVAFATGGATASNWYRAYDQPILMKMTKEEPFGIDTRRLTSASFQVYQSLLDDSNWVELGPAAIHGRAEGNMHGVRGDINQNNAVGDFSFPFAVGGEANLNSSGNQAFGVFARATGHTAGVITNELNTFNYFEGPPGTYPPDRAFGISTAMPVTLTIAAGGDYQSYCGIHICGEGSEPQSYVTGIYTNPEAVTGMGIFIDGTEAHSPDTCAYFKNKGRTPDSSGVVIQTVNNTPDPSYRPLRIRTPDGTDVFAITTGGQIALGDINMQTTVGPAGAAAALPAKPKKYLKYIDNDGSIIVIPAYAGA